MFKFYLDTTNRLICPYQQLSLALIALLSLQGVQWYSQKRALLVPKINSFYWHKPLCLSKPLGLNNIQFKHTHK